jgi:hypothetical protein
MLGLLWEASYLLLWVLTGLSGLILKETLVEASKLTDSLPKTNAKGKGKCSMVKAPLFSATVVGSDHEMSTRDLLGAPARLVFVRPADIEPKFYRYFREFVEDGPRGNRFVVCNSGEVGCGELIRWCGSRVPSIPLLIDSDEEIRKMFAVDEQGIRSVDLDGDTLITKYEMISFPKSMSEKRKLETN